MSTEYYLESTAPDPAVWVPVPAEWPDRDDGVDRPGGPADDGDGPARWARSAARAVAGRGGPAGPPDDTDALARVLEFCARNCPDAHPGFEVLLHLPDPRRAPLPVYLGEYPFEGDPRAETRYATGLDEADGERPPAVEEFPTPALGPGLRVLRDSRDADDPAGAAQTVLRYAWATARPGLTACLFTTHPHRRRVLEALPDLDALARGLRWVREE